MRQRVAQNAARCYVLRYSHMYQHDALLLTALKIVSPRGIPLPVVCNKSACPSRPSFHSRRPHRYSRHADRLRTRVSLPRRIHPVTYFRFLSRELVSPPLKFAFPPENRWIQRKCHYGLPCGEHDDIRHSRRGRRIENFMVGTEHCSGGPE